MIQAKDQIKALQNEIQNLKKQLAFYEDIPELDRHIEIIREDWDFNDEEGWHYKNDEAVPMEIENSRLYNKKKVDWFNVAT